MMMAMAMMMMIFKVEVNGSGEHEIFKHLKAALPLPQVFFNSTQDKFTTMQKDKFR